VHKRLAREGDGDAAPSRRHADGQRPEIAAPLGEQALDLVQAVGSPPHAVDGGSEASRRRVIRTVVVAAAKRSSAATVMR